MQPRYPARVRLVYTSLFRRSTPQPPPGLINYPSYISPRTRARPFELPRASTSTCERDLLRLLTIHRPTAPRRLNCRCDDTPRAFLFTLRSGLHVILHFGTQPPIVDLLTQSTNFFTLLDFFISLNNYIRENYTEYICNLRKGKYFSFSLSNIFHMYGTLRELKYMDLFLSLGGILFPSTFCLDLPSLLYERVGIFPQISRIVCRGVFSCTPLDVRRISQQFPIYRTVSQARDDSSRGEYSASSSS